MKLTFGKKNIARVTVVTLALLLAIIPSLQTIEVVKAESWLATPPTITPISQSKDTFAYNDTLSFKISVGELNPEVYNNFGNMLMWNNFFFINRMSYKGDWQPNIVYLDHLGNTYSQPTNIAVLLTRSGHLGDFKEYTLNVPLNDVPVGTHSLLINITQQNPVIVFENENRSTGAAAWISSQLQFEFTLNLAAPMPTPAPTPSETPTIPILTSSPTAPTTPIPTASQPPITSDAPSRARIQTESNSASVSTIALEPNPTEAPNLTPTETPTTVSPEVPAQVLTPTQTVATDQTLTANPTADPTSTAKTSNARFASQDTVIALAAFALIVSVGTSSLVILRKRTFKKEQIA